MKRFRYPDCPGGPGCRSLREGRAMCFHCQPAAPFGFLPANCANFDRLRLGRF